MRLEELSYDLPPSFIAQLPASDRESCRLLVLERKTGSIRHGKFKDIAAYLSPLDENLLVLNDSRVFKARLFAQAGRNRIEVFIVEKLSPRIFEVLLRPKRRLKKESALIFDDGTKARVVDFANNLVEFEREMDWEDFDNIGTMPLPPYIKRSPSSGDDLYYQTVYSRNPGSLAASTAGLHFTPHMLEDMKSGGIEVVSITLHISYGTFRPIKSDVLEKHPMLAEYFHLSEAAAEKINEARRKGKKIIAVGTSAVRALESSVDFSGRIIPFQGFTELFIYPGYRFKAVDRMITNFHLPRSSPLSLVAALAGKERIFRAYGEAVRNGYRFYSYGDAMLIL